MRQSGHANEPATGTATIINAGSGERSPELQKIAPVWPSGRRCSASHDDGKARARGFRDAGMNYVNGSQQPIPTCPSAATNNPSSSREHGKFGLAEFMEVKAMVGALA